jgi:hypothetical protein
MVSDFPRMRRSGVEETCSIWTRVVSAYLDPGGRHHRMIRQLGEDVSGHPIGRRAVSRVT